MQVVLLHAYQKGFSAMEVAIMFSFYELVRFQTCAATPAATVASLNAALSGCRPRPPPSQAGVVTNLAAGLMGARWGIKSTLLTGLTLQLAGIGMLFGWQVRRAHAAAAVAAASSCSGASQDAAAPDAG